MGALVLANIKRVRAFVHAFESRDAGREGLLGPPTPITTKLAATDIVCATRVPNLNRSCAAPGGGWGGVWSIGRRGKALREGGHNTQKVRGWVDHRS